MKSRRLSFVVLAFVSLAWGLMSCDAAADAGRATFDKLKLRAEAGESEAQVALANIYCGRHASSHEVAGGRTTTIMNTKGIVDEDPQAAVMWFRKAADQGRGEGAFGLAQLHHFPNASWEGVTANLSEALKWYRKADELGVSGVQQEIAQKWIRELPGLLEVDDKSAQESVLRPKKK